MVGCETQDSHLTCSGNLFVTNPHSLHVTWHTWESGDPKPSCKPESRGVLKSLMLIPAAKDDFHHCHSNTAKHHACVQPCTKGQEEDEVECAFSPLFKKPVCWERWDGGRRERGGKGKDDYFTTSTTINPSTCVLNCMTCVTFNKWSLFIVFWIPKFYLPPAFPWLDTPKLVATVDHNIWDKFILVTDLLQSCES